VDDSLIGKRKIMKLKFQVLSKPHLTLLKQTSQEDCFIIFLLTTSYIIYELQLIIKPRNLINSINIEVKGSGEKKGK
jgi:hypothetical protein